MYYKGLDLNNSIDVYCAQKAAKNIIFTYIDTWNFNKNFDDSELDGLTKVEMEIQFKDEVFAWWWIIVISLDVLSLGSLIVFITLLTLEKNKKEEMANKRRKKMKKSKIINFTSIATVAALVGVVNVLALGVFADALDIAFGTEIADQETVTAARQDGENLALQIEQEGIVLLENKIIGQGGGKDIFSLPLDQSQKKLNVFGWSSTQWIGGGSGSGRVVASNRNMNVETGLLEALENEGIEYNTELTDLYKEYCGSRPKYTQGTLNSYEYEFHRIIEPDIDTDYDNGLLERAMSYSDTALVVIGRMSGESNDAPKVQYKGNSISSQVSDSSRTYLDISTEEEKLLSYVGYNYENVIVIVNSTNTMNLSFMSEIEGLDSCLLVGATGVNAAKAIPSILFGEVSPSGRTADTYAYDFSTAASYANAGMEGENFYTNGKSLNLYPADGTNYGNVGNSNAKYPGVSYVDYAESIYIGYKWYETADSEGFWDTDFAKQKWSLTNGYDDVVQYPFGYGKSYTDFSYEIVGLNHNNNTSLGKDDTIEVTVRVKNIGEVKGKEVVEFYYTPQYYSGQIEKSSINLAGFGKTTVLEPGQYEDLKLSFNVRDMANYDAYDSNGNDFKGYEIDKGTYQIKLMKDAHHQAEVVKTNDTVHDNAVIQYKVDETIKYEVDAYSNNPVTNKFTGEEAIDGIGIDGEDTNANINYLSRMDFESGFPVHQAARSIPSNVAELNLYTSRMSTDWINSSDTDITTGVNKNLKVFENGKINDLGLALGKDYNDSQWDDVLNQMSLDEMKKLVLHGYVKNDAINSIGKPRFIDVDGPAQIGSFNQQNVGTGFPNATTVGQTWSSSLAYDFGLALGKETKVLGYDGWYGPGLNLHRSPFGGRNYEYYSEDSYLSGMMAANAVKGAKNTGVYSYLKHLAVYDQESYRDGLYTWLTEQAFREIYLRPFQMAVQLGGATGIMTSYNRVGAVWAGGSEALLTHVLREEWGFRGCVLTDYADHHSYMSMDHALRAGGDLYMDGLDSKGAFKMETSSNSFKQALRRASKNIIYMSLNALYTNSIYNAADDVEPIIIGAKQTGPSKWKIYFYVADGVIVAGLIAWGLLVGLKKEKESKKENSQEQN